MALAPAVYTWLGEALGHAAQNLTLNLLQGSTSSSVFSVQLAHSPQQFVLRVVDNAVWLAEEPDLAAHEAAALTEAQRAGLRAPHWVAYTANDLGGGGPMVLMTFVVGQVDLCPPDFERWLGALARALAAIHAHRAPDFPWHFRSWVNPNAFIVPAWATRPLVWERALARMRAPAPAVQPVFIHRDYHPTNVLWQGAQISGVVDWINACQGPAGVDVAHCRSNLAQMFGPQAAAQFLAAYCAAAPSFVYDPYWDLDSVFDMCYPQPTFYAPWQAFGLAPIPLQVLHQRVEDYLAEVVAHI